MSSVLCNPPESDEPESPEVTAAYLRVGEACDHLRSVLKSEGSKDNLGYGEDEIQIGRWCEQAHRDTER